MKQQRERYVNNSMQSIKISTSNRKRERKEKKMEDAREPNPVLVHPLHLQRFPFSSTSPIYLFLSTKNRACINYRRQEIESGKSALK